MTFLAEVDFCYVPVRTYLYMLCHLCNKSSQCSFMRGDGLLQLFEALLGVALGPQLEVELSSMLL